MTQLKIQKVQLKLKRLSYKRFFLSKTETIGCCEEI